MGVVNLKITKVMISVLSVLLLGLFLAANFQTVHSGSLAMKSSDNWLIGNDSEKLEFLKNKTKKQLITVEDAAKEVKYQLMKPTNTHNKKLLGIFQSNAPAGEEGNEQIIMLYEDGMHIKQIPVDSTPDYELLVQDLIERKNRGTLKSDKVPILLKINGYPAVGIEPGFNLLNNKNEPRPGFVQWYENGVYYIVKSPNLSLKDLIQIAESMVKVN